MTRYKHTVVSLSLMHSIAKKDGILVGNDVVEHYLNTYVPPNLALVGFSETGDTDPCCRFIFREGRTIAPCKVCGKIMHDLYKVHDALWLSAGLGRNDNACLPCLERLLKRPLTLDDFTAVKCNNSIRWAFERARST